MLFTKLDKCVNNKADDKHRSPPPSLSVYVRCHWVMCSAVLHDTAVRLWRE